ncbi:DUF6285 domain-containing protein [Pelagibius marinus]|uniref:DUF6285 domain-containing protein n=1 Tax=Pelagibius marinus TaxID=2762760 RepID=UPI0018727F7B|nr:DUF6285 domain-containing protein [Pelagibius marinus]
MSAGQGKGGGEADGVRLLHLARRELLDVVLPTLEGDARYRARLIANAMKIAAQEMDLGAGNAAATAGELEAFAAGLDGAPADGPQGPREAIRDALRSGEVDGNADLFALLERMTGRRRALLG